MVGSEAFERLAVLGGKAVYLQHNLFDASRSIGRAVESTFKVSFVGPIDEVLDRVINGGSGDMSAFKSFLTAHPELPFGIAQVGPRESSPHLEADLWYGPAGWDLPAEPVVRCVAAELGIEPVDPQLPHYLRLGILRLGRSFFEERRAPFALLQRALLKLAEGYRHTPTRLDLLVWARQFED